MPITLTLPLWMVERIVDALRQYPYADPDEIIREIVGQMEEM